jgi:hypothetical protein
MGKPADRDAALLLDMTRCGSISSGAWWPSTLTP